MFALVLLLLCLHALIFFGFYNPWGVIFASSLRSRFLIVCLHLHVCFKLNGVFGLRQWNFSYKAYLYTHIYLEPD